MIGRIFFNHKKRRRLKKKKKKAIKQCYGQTHVVKPRDEFKTGVVRDVQEARKHEYEARRSRRFARKPLLSPSCFIRAFVTVVVITF